MNVDAIFNAFDRASSLVHLHDEIGKKLKQIRSVEAHECGNCYHWMKSSCRPEKELRQFKTCNSIGCKDFELCPMTAKTAERFKEELQELRARLAAI